MSSLRLHIGCGEGGGQKRLNTCQPGPKRDELNATGVNYEQASDACGIKIETLARDPELLLLSAFGPSSGLGRTESLPASGFFLILRNAGNEC